MISIPFIKSLYLLKNRLTVPLAVTPKKGVYSKSPFTKGFLDFIFNSIFLKPMLTTNAVEIAIVEEIARSWLDIGFDAGALEIFTPKLKAWLRDWKKAWLNGVGGN